MPLHLVAAPNKANLNAGEIPSDGANTAIRSIAPFIGHIEPEERKKT